MTSGNPPLNSHHTIANLWHAQICTIRAATAHGDAIGELARLELGNNHRPAEGPSSGYDGWTISQLIGKPGQPLKTGAFLPSSHSAISGKSRSAPAFDASAAEPAATPLSLTILRRNHHREGITRNFSSQIFLAPSQHQSRSATLRVL